MWNPQGLPSPGSCVVDICRADNDFSCRMTGADLTVIKRELGILDCACVLTGDLCQIYEGLYTCCAEICALGRNLDYVECASYTNETACENANCTWNSQGLPAPGTCVVDICRADSDFSGRLTGGDLAVFKRELGRLNCACQP